MSETKVVTGLVRISFPKLFEAEETPSGQLKFGAQLLIDKTDKATIKKIKAAVEAAKEIGKVKKWSGIIPKALKLPLRDGDAEKEGEQYENCFFVNATSDNKPGVCDRNVQPITDEDEIYPGCYVIASVNFYPFNEGGSKGVACGLNNIMKVKDGPRLDGRTSAAQDFKDVELPDFDDEDEADIDDLM